LPRVSTAISAQRLEIVDFPFDTEFPVDEPSLEPVCDNEMTFYLRLRDKNAVPASVLRRRICQNQSRDCDKIPG